MLGSKLSLVLSSKQIFPEEADFELTGTSPAKWGGGGGALGEKDIGMTVGNPRKPP